jgi:predicted membrane protein
MNDAASPPAMRQRTTLGLVLIAIGLFFALANAGVLHTDGLGRWWPLLLIGIGFVKVRQPRESGQRATGVAFLLLGGLFQLTAVLTVTSFWTLPMIGFGAFLLWQAVEAPRREAAAASPSPYVGEMVLIGGVKRMQHPSDFRGGSLTAVMGGIELDLRKTVLIGGTAYVDVVAFWGGVVLKVPPEWTVDARVVPIMGAFENKVEPLPAGGGPSLTMRDRGLVVVETPREPRAAGAPRLVVRGHAIMGAVVIGN